MKTALRTFAFLTLFLGTLPLFGIEKRELDLSKLGHKVYSQNEEDGIIQGIFNLVGTDSKYYVEFGAAEGHRGSNTKFLREYFGWNGLLLDIAYSSPLLNLHKEKVSAENINALFEKYNVPKNLDLLSIDIDGNDFYVWQAIDPEYRPRLIVIEYNATHLPHEDKIIVYDPDHAWDGTNYYGASMLAMYRLGKAKGYSLVAIDNNCMNLFFVRDDLLEGRDFTFKNINDVNQLYRKPKYNLGGPNDGHRQDYNFRPFVSSDEFISKPSD